MDGQRSSRVRGKRSDADRVRARRDGRRELPEAGSRARRIRTAHGVRDAGEWGDGLPGGPRDADRGLRREGAAGTPRAGSAPVRELRRPVARRRRKRSLLSEFERSAHSRRATMSRVVSEVVDHAAAMPRRGMPSPVSLRSTTAWGSAAAGARGSIRERAGPRAKRAAPGRSVSFARANAHAALVFDGDAAVAWCQYGSPEELPNIHHRKEYEADPHGGAARLSPHVHLRRQGLSTERRRRCGASRRPRPDREGGRRRGRGLSAGHAGQEDLGLSFSTTPRAASTSRPASATSGPRARTIACKRQHRSIVTDASGLQVHVARASEHSDSISAD